MTANTPGILDYLREFQQAVFAGRDIFTVAEANGVGPDELKDWVGSQGVFDMLFEFSHMNLNFRENEVWCYPNDWKLSELKKALSDSQAATAMDGWYPIFFENHDQPRSVNKFSRKEQILNWQQRRWGRYCLLCGGRHSSTKGRNWVSQITGLGECD